MAGKMDQSSPNHDDPFSHVVRRLCFFSVPNNVNFGGLKSKLRVSKRNPN